MTARRPGARIAPQPWMLEPATQAVVAALAAGGVEARFVGGSVRDALLGRPLDDIDIATPAPPEQVTALLEKCHIRVVPTGIAHGTVTAILPPRQFEITTLRRDVETFGRHARVEFDADWTADAERRDFTMNAIYLSPDGTIHDPVGGLADLYAGRVRFVGDPAQRIAEDVLRLLRYYRFEARFGGAGDPDARAACRAAAHLLPRLSGERVAQELTRLLQTPAPLRALQMMQEDGVLGVILPEARRLDRLARLVALEPEIDPLRRLAALIATGRDGALWVADRLRFSNSWHERLAGLAPPWPLAPDADPRARRRALYELGVERFRDLALLLAANGQLPRPSLDEMLELAQRWQRPEFPLAGRDALALGLSPGPEIGRLLAQVRQWWEAGDFAADWAQCLARLRDLVKRSRQPPHP